MSREFTSLSLGREFYLNRRSHWAAFAATVVVGTAAAALVTSTLQAQSPPNEPVPQVTTPEPIYWKQSLFQIPYQWGSAAEPGAAKAVQLYVSKDRGTSWHNISEAKPNVTSFNYRAEGEGEYWFAVRTLDYKGRSWPAGELSAEIRVIVDTTMPQITNLRAAYRGDGAIEIERAGFDQNLDPTTWKFEVQSESTGPWQEVPHLERHLADSGVADPAVGVGASRVELQPPAGQPATAVRATVLDRAGNMATFHTNIQAPGNIGGQSETTESSAMQRLPFVNLRGGLTNQPAINPFLNIAPPTLPTTSPSVPTTDAAATTAAQPQGWVSSPDASLTTSPQSAQPSDQPWPANATARAPFRLWSGGLAATQDAVTSYGNPTGIAPPPLADGGSNATSLYANVSTPWAAPSESQQASAEPSFQPLGPFRQASISRSPASIEGAQSALPPKGTYSQQLPPDVQPKLVGSRTFALEYELDDAGGRGVSGVELWGTRDGGQTWRAYSRDDDNRSPLVVTVDEEGLFGFRIVVEGSGGASPLRPTTGDQPELWVVVDLHCPTAELSAIEPGNGNLADHLILRWRAADDNLEARPISFFYSSLPVGPWSAIATNLENTGEYAWRVERHVPTRFYLRLEARDTAGNSAAFQTRDPIEFATPAASGRLRSTQPVDPTATGTSTSYR